MSTGCLACSAGGFGGFRLSSVQPPFWIRWRLGELGRECENVGGGGGGEGKILKASAVECRPSIDTRSTSRWIVDRHSIDIKVE